MYFNERFEVSAIQMRRLGVFNPEIGVDSKMFVDPKLLLTAKDEFANSHGDLLTYFAGTATLIKLIKTKTDSDIAWVRAWKRMMFRETSNTSLGFSKESTDGSGIGKVLAKRIVARAAEILPHVDYQPDIFELIGVFAEGLGCDRLSDMVVSILMARFLAYTNRITLELGIQQTATIKLEGKEFACPRYKKGDKLTILLPQEILKPLPIALDIEEALANADLNEQTRSEVNRVFAEAQRHHVTLGKNRLRELIRSNRTMYRGILEGYKRAKGIPYDFDTDPEKVSDFEPIAREIVGKPTVNLEGLDPWARIAACVRDSIGDFRRGIEENKLSDVLYDDKGLPRKEIISQRIIYQIASIFGRFYNVDVSQQGNAGPGAVDFRFTVGHSARLLIEMKLSIHERLKNGYYEQLPAYARAEGIKKMILLILRVDKDDKHLNALEQSIALKSLPIQLVIIDAVPKPSASKRKAQI